MEMPLFTIASPPPSPPARQHWGRAFLIQDRWDDWGKFQTQFRLHVIDTDGQQHHAGLVKIGETGLQASPPTTHRRSGFRTPTLPPQFDTLPPSFFSLGQNENYYETLTSLRDNLGTRILRALRDCALDLDILSAHQNEEVMSESLLRDVNKGTVRTRLHRLAHGNSKLTTFNFNYHPARSSIQARAPTALSFLVNPNSSPPTNIHVLIGRNGAGKTTCLQGIVNAILGVPPDPVRHIGEISFPDANPEAPMLAGLVVVSFSAFDELDVTDRVTNRIRPKMVGILTQSPLGKQSKRLKTRKELGEDFISSLAECRNGIRAGRLRDAIRTLEADPLLTSYDIGSLVDRPDPGWKPLARQLFRQLSSGHAIALLTITRLVELVDERTLVVLDEPETHLHPPLLSALIRAISELLNKRNGVAIVATHSPVVLQETPRSCVWMIRRNGESSSAERPSIETFGENVGTLTSEVFGLEVTDSGFHRLLRQSQLEDSRYDSIVNHFGGQLGSEARAILMAITIKNTEPT